MEVPADNVGISGGMLADIVGFSGGCQLILWGLVGVSGGDAS